MKRKLWLHVGTPKSGTTFLQSVAWQHRGALRAAGLLLPGSARSDHFRATADLRGEPYRLKDPALAAGAWQRLVDLSARWGGDVLISHELFGPASADRATTGVTLLAEAAGPDAEVHVVITARDLARQIPAEWQEHLKHRSKLDFPTFVRSVREDDDGPFSPNGYHFWRVQDLPALVDRWVCGLPVDRIHVITVPPAGVAREELWWRFAGLLGVSDVKVDLDVGRRNRSLAAEQAELVRRLNATLGDRLPLPGPYSDIVKGFLVHRVLSGRPGTSFGLLGDDYVFARERAERIVDGLERRGVNVVGDLADLQPSPDQPPIDDLRPLSGTAHVPETLVTEEAIEALVAALESLNAERERVARLRSEAMRPGFEDQGAPDRGKPPGPRRRLLAAASRLRRNVSDG